MATFRKTFDSLAGAVQEVHQLLLPDFSDLLDPLLSKYDVDEESFYLTLGGCVGRVIARRDEHGCCVEMRSERDDGMLTLKFLLEGLAVYELCVQRPLGNNRGQGYAFTVKYDTVLDAQQLKRWCELAEALGWEEDVDGDSFVNLVSGVTVAGLSALES